MRIRARISDHPLLAALIGLAVVGLSAFVLYFFEPQALFIDDKVDEALPTAKAPAASGEEAPASGAKPKTLANGTFRGLAHEASGKALVLELEDGSTVLRFEDLNVSNGPDLKVYLSTAPSSSDEGAFDDDFLDLGELKGNIGSQNYELRDVDVSRFRSAVVWCKRFGVGFAVAPIQQG